MSDCIFCNILNKKSSAQIVYEDDDVFALVPLEQVSKGHTLLIPKQHVTDIFDIEEELFAKFAKVMKKLSIQLVKDNNANAINLLNASGKDAQQSVLHLHFHLVPRYPNDGLDLWIKQNL